MRVSRFPGFLWLVLLTGSMTLSAGTLIDVAFTQAAVTGKTGFAAIGVTSNDFWNTCTVNQGGSVADLKYVDETVSSAGITIFDVGSAYSNGSSDPMYGTYMYTFPNSGNITVVITDLVSGLYDLYFYGHGNADNQNTIYQLFVGEQSYGSEATTNGSGWLSSVWQEGVQYVEFTNVGIAPGQPITVLAEPGASGYAVISGMQLALNPAAESLFIVTPPTNETVPPGVTATFSVTAGGALPLKYQWHLNGGNIPGATSSSYVIANAQTNNEGIYSVTVSNQYGSITTTNAVLIVVVPSSTSMIDVAFRGASVTSETGFAATGVSSTDFWNTCEGMGSTGSIPNLDFVNGTPSGAEMTINGISQVAGNGLSDAMYGTFLFVEDVYSPSTMVVTINNLPEGTYDFLIYGHGGQDNQNGFFQLNVGTQDDGTQGTTTGAGWSSPIWQTGMQYVEFDGVRVAPSQTVTITVETGTSGYGIISGLQMVGPTLSNVFINAQPQNQAVAQDAVTTFDVLAGGLPPLVYQWQFDNIPIAGATDSSYSVIGAQLTNIGSYSVIVTNVYGSVTSAVATLNVTIPSLIDIAFTSASATDKMGFAAVGITSNDFWNTCTSVTGYSGSGLFALPGTVSNLEFVNQTPSFAGLTVIYPGSAGAYNNGSADPMYGAYMWDQSGDIIITITNLPAGLYDFYLYGHGNQNNQNTIFDLQVGLQNYGNEATIDGTGWLLSSWQEGVQYVEFTNVTVLDGTTITITAEAGPSGYAVISGLQMVIPVTSDSSPVIFGASNLFLNVGQGISFASHAFDANWPILFSLGPGAPAGATVTPWGLFSWLPTCEQGSTTNTITIWATDSGTPPKSNSMTFDVTVGPCAEVSIGSNAIQAGQTVCVPVNLFTTTGLTNLNFILVFPEGFLTNWNVTPNNSALASAMVQSIDPTHTEFYFDTQTGQTLQGNTLLGSICVGTLDGPSGFVPLTAANMSFAAADGAPVSAGPGYRGRIAVVGPQPLVDIAIGSNLSPSVTLYGNPGVGYNLLSTTNLSASSSWNMVGSVTLTDLFQTFSFGASNQAQFFKARQP